MVHGDFERGFIADLNRTIILMLVRAHCVVYYFKHAHDSVNTHQNENRFLAFRSLISNTDTNAGVENE